LTLSKVDVKLRFPADFHSRVLSRSFSFFIFCAPMKDFGILLQVAGI
jgi:hypothetical protein